MIKKLLIVAALTTASVGTKAQSLQVEDVVLPQNGTASIEIELNNPDHVFEGFTFSVELPEGIAPVLDGEGHPAFIKGSRLSSSQNPQSGYLSEENTANFALLTNGTSISGTSGLLIVPTITLSTTAAVGTTFYITISNAKFTTNIPTREDLSDVTFKVTVGEPVDTRTVLDETSTTAPEAATDVDVRVRRTINANEWSTICLPFAMSTAQVEEAFGEDVELADFDGIESTTDGDENVTDIMVKFVDATAIEANHPYLIKVSSAISEFTVDGVDIAPEEEPSVDKDEYRSGSGTKKDPYVYHYNSFVGTYVANTDVPDLCLFLSGNKFWYSTGLTKMKAFRGYFDFYDVLAEVENQPASSKIRFNIDGGMTTIENCTTISDEEETWHTLDGRSLNSKPATKGIYIFNKKKVMIK